MADPRGVVITEVAFTDDPTVESPAWTDVSGYVKSSSCQRGRGSELEQVQPGTLSAVFRNNDRTFDPSYANGPYYGYLLPMRRIRQRIERAGYSVSAELVTQSDAVTDALRSAATSGDAKPSQPFDFMGGFETGDASEWTSMEAADPPVNFQMATAPVRDGNYSGKFTVRSGDVVASGERCELSWTASDESDGDEYFYGWSTYFPTDWQPRSGSENQAGSTSGSYAVISQFHDDTATGPPNLAFRATGSDLKARLNAGTLNGSGLGTNDVLYTLVSGFTKGVWHDFIVHVLWETSATGFLRVWHKEEADSTYTLVLDQSAMITLQIAGAGAASSKCWFKQGLYRSNETFTDVIYHDSFRRGSSFYDIAHGMDSPESSYGIWPSAINLCINGNATTNTTGSAAIAGGVVTRESVDADEAAFGTTRWKCTTPGVAVSEGFLVRTATALQGTSGVAAGDTFILSASVKRRTSTRAQVAVTCRINYTDATNDNSTATLYDLTEYYARLVTLPITANGAKTIDSVQFRIATTGVAQTTEFYVGGIQSEEGTIPTPYIAADGAAASRAAARVQAPVIPGTLDETQGWMAAQVRLGWASTDSTATNPYVWRWRDDDNNELRLRYDTGTDTWVMDRRNAGSGGPVTSAAVSFPRGGMAFVIASWTATTVKVSVDGAAFVSAANTNIPALAATTFDVGSSIGANNFLSGDVKWMAWGTGTLSDADASSLYDTYGRYHTDPIPSDSIFPATAAVAASWFASDARVFVNDSAYLFSGYVESWGQSWPDRLFQSDTTVTATDGFKVLNLVGQPVSNPNVEGYEEVVGFNRPSFYYLLGEPEGTKVVHHVRYRHGGKWKGENRRNRRYRTRERITRAEVEGMSGPAGSYKNTPDLGEAGIIAGDSGTSVRFKSASNEYVNIEIDNDDLITNNRLTISVWVKIASFNAAQAAIVAGGYNVAAAARGFTLYASNTGNVIAFNIQDSGGLATEAAVAVPQDVWMHVGATWDGSTARIYINGVLEDEITDPRTMTAGDAGILLIGKMTGVSDWFNGWLQHVAIYEKALSAERIAAHYTAGTRGFAQEPTGTRIANALNATALSIPQNLDAGTRQILPVRQFGQETLQPVDEAVDVEGGSSMFFFAANGTATFFDRDYKTKALHANSAVTIGDGLTDDVPMEDVTVSDDEQVLFNQVRVEASGGETQEVNDGPSQDRFFTRTMELSGVLMTSDADALDEAEDLLERYSQPQQRIRSVVINPGMEETAQEQAVIRELGDHITVIRRPLGGDAITQDSFIQSIGHEINFEGGSWLTTFSLEGVATPAATGARYFDSHLKAQMLPPIRVRQQPLSRTYLNTLNKPGGSVRLTRTR